MPYLDRFESTSDAARRIHPSSDTGGVKLELQVHAEPSLRDRHPCARDMQLIRERRAFPAQPDCLRVQRAQVRLRCGQLRVE